MKCWLHDCWGKKICSEDRYLQLSVRFADVNLTKKSDTECDCLWHTLDGLSLFGKNFFWFPYVFMSSSCMILGVKRKWRVCTAWTFTWTPTQTSMVHGNCVFTCGVQNGGNMLKLSRFASHILKGKKIKCAHYIVGLKHFQVEDHMCGWKNWLPPIVVRSLKQPVQAKVQVTKAD